MPGIDRAVTSTTAAFYHRWSAEADCFADLGAYMWHASHDPYQGWRDTDERFKDLGGFHVTPSLPSVPGDQASAWGGFSTKRRPASRNIRS